MPKQVSSAADFAEPETVEFDLPRPGPGGKVLTVRLRAVPPVELVQAMEGVPDLNRAEGAEQQSFEQARSVILQNAKPTERVVALGVVEPQFCFGEPEEGKATWKNVHGENQAAIVKAIMDLSGFGASGGAQAAAGEFRRVDKQ